MQALTSLKRKAAFRDITNTVKQMESTDCAYFIITVLIQNDGGKKLCPKSFYHQFFFPF